MSRIDAKMGQVQALKSVDPEALAIWTYQRQKADVVMEHGVTLNRVERLLSDGLGAGDRSMTTDSAALVESLASGAGGMGSVSNNALHHDAETVHEYVRRLQPHLRKLIIECAQTGSRPEWCETRRTRLVPIRRADGMPRVVWSKNGDYPLYSPLVVVDHPAFIAMHRELYGQWWDALAEMGRHLMRDSLLASHTVSPMRCVRAPWERVQNQGSAVAGLTSR